MGEINSGMTMELAPKKYEFATNIRLIRPKSELNEKVEKTASVSNAAASIAIKGTDSAQVGTSLDLVRAKPVDALDSIKSFDSATLFASEISEQAKALSREDLLSSVAGRLDPTAVFMALKD